MWHTFADMTDLIDDIEDLIGDNHSFKIVKSVKLIQLIQFYSKLLLSFMIILLMYLYWLCKTN